MKALQILVGPKHEELALCVELLTTRTEFRQTEFRGARGLHTEGGTQDSLTGQKPKEAMAT